MRKQKESIPFCGFMTQDGKWTVVRYAPPVPKKENPILQWVDKVEQVLYMGSSAYALDQDL